MKKSAVFMVIMAGVLWGTMGVFVRWFSELGFAPMQVAAMRIISGTVFVILFAALTVGIEAFRIDFRDIGWFIASGVISVLGMSWLYFEALARSSMCVAAILLYTAPFIVTVLSCIFFREPFTLKKLSALIIAFFGCVMVTGIDGDVTVSGVIIALASGFAYALYSIFGKVLLKKYRPITVTVYSFFIASVCYGFVGNFPGIAGIVSGSDKPVLLIAMGIIMGVVTATSPFVLYTYGLNGMDAGKASIMAYTEPLVASVCGFVVFGEFTGFVSVTGIALIIFAVLLINNFGRKSHD